MTDLVLGWPQKTEEGTARKTWKTESHGKYGDLSRAEKYSRDGHLVTFAPTGAGKGVRVIIPNLLHYTGPVITIDPKGENFAVTARYRKEVLGQQIFLLDPFEFVKRSVLSKLGVERAALNPLDFIASVGSNIDTQLAMMASSLSTRDHSTSDDKDRFWDNEAQKLLVGTLGLTIEEAELDVSKKRTFRTFLEHLYSDDVVYNLAVVLDKYKGKLSSVTHKSIAAFLQKADKERSGVLSTAHSYLNLFIAPALNHYLNTSSISAATLLETDDYTIYIVIPPSKLVSHSTLLRLWISTMLSIVMERDERPLKRTLFLLDECAQLGALDGLRKAVTLMRGYGLQVWMFFQDVAQVDSLYEVDANTIIGNCAVFQAFGIPRDSSAKDIVDIVGKFEPQQLVTLDETQQVLSLANRDPTILRMPNYLKDPAFRGRFDPNPLFKNSTKKRQPVDPFPPNFIKIGR